MLRVADLDVSGRFYARIGLALREERHGTGPRHLSADLGGTVLELYPRGTGPASTGLRLGLVVPDQARVVDALALARLGANVVADGERMASASWYYATRTATPWSWHRLRRRSCSTG